MYERDCEEVSLATKYMLQTALPSAASKLAGCSRFTSSELRAFLHGRGINMRYVCELGRDRGERKERVATEKLP